MTNLTHMPVTEQSPVEIDTALAALSETEQQNRYWLASHREHVARETKRNPDYAETYNGERAAETDARYLAAIKAARTESEPYEAEYKARGGWHRYFLVQNTGGHIHRGMNCTTCYFDTRYRWLIDLADCDERQMVSEYGELACTVCFPDAPTYSGFGDGTSAIAKLSAAEKQAKADAKAERAAKKAAKQLAEPVRVRSYAADRFPEHIETIAAAKSWLKRTIDSRHWGRPENFDTVTDESIATVSAALEARGVDVAPMIAKWEKAAAKLYG